MSLSLLIIMPPFQRKRFRISLHCVHPQRVVLTELRNIVNLLCENVQVYIFARYSLKSFQTWVRKISRSQTDGNETLFEQEGL